MEGFFKKLVFARKVLAFRRGEEWRAFILFYGLAKKRTPRRASFCFVFYSRVTTGMTMGLRFVFLNR